MGLVSIIVLNYNGGRFNKPCIDSILKQNYHDFEIIFIDNASTDGSLEHVKEIYLQEIQSKKIIIVENKINTGFAGGNNLGVKHANMESEYICLLNNDTTVPQNRLQELIKSIESDKHLGAVGSIVLDRGYEEQIRKYTFEDTYIHTTSIFGENILQHYSKKEYENKLAYSGVLSGCCLMYKKDIISQPFPDYYFAYAEDVYLSWYILKSGYKLAYSLDSLVYHYGSGSFGKNPSSLKLFHGNKNQIINFLIFYSIKDIILLFPLFIIKEFSHLFLSGGGKRCRAKIKAWIWICKNYQQIKQSKTIVKSATKITEKQFISNLSTKLSDTNIFYYHFNKIQKKILQGINRFFMGYIRVIRKFL